MVATHFWKARRRDPSPPTDGKKIYMPAGEGSGSSTHWMVLDALSGSPIGRINHVSNPHNTIVSLDGRYAFLEGQEKGPEPAD